MKPTELSAVADICQLKARYFRALDTKQWSLFANIFTDDATADGREGFASRDGLTGDWTVNGPPDLVAQHLKNLDIESMMVTGGQAIASKAEELFPHPIVTVHQGHMPEITLETETVAQGIWAMEDIILYPKGYPLRELRGYGHYHEQYRCDNGVWRITAFRLTRLRIDIL